MHPKAGRIALVLVQLVWTAWSASGAEPLPVVPAGLSISLLTDRVQNPVALVHTGLHLFGLDPVTGSVFRITLAAATLTHIARGEKLSHARGLALSPEATLFVSLQAHRPHHSIPGSAQEEPRAGIEELTGAGFLRSIVVKGAPLMEPMGAALAPRSFGHFAGQLIVADGAGSLWAINAKLHRVTLVTAGRGSTFGMDGGKASELARPVDITFDINETLLVADAARGILRVLPTGDVTSFVEISALGGTPTALAVHKCTGDLYVAVDAARQAVMKIEKRTGAVRVFASGFGHLGGSVGIGGLEFSPDGSRLYVGDPGAHKIYQIWGFGGCARARTILTSTMRAMPIGTGLVQPGGLIEYRATIENDGATQSDNAGHELEIPIPARTAYVPGTATATAGNVRYNPNTNRIAWNGVLLPAARVTVTFRVKLGDGFSTGALLSNQGHVFYDSDGDGVNETRALTDDPDTALPGDATVLTVVLKGDIDGDGVITAGDLLQLKRFFRRLATLTPAQLAAADVVAPCGRINWRDLSRLTTTVERKVPLQNECDNVFTKYEVVPDASSAESTQDVPRADRSLLRPLGLPASQSAKLAIYDSAGRLVHLRQWTGGPLGWAAGERPDLANGLYLYVLWLRDANGGVTQRIGKLARVR